VITGLGVLIVALILNIVFMGVGGAIGGLLAGSD